MEELDTCPEAAEAMEYTDRLFSLGLVDHLVREPLGGAHQAPVAATALVMRLKGSLIFWSVCRRATTRVSLSKLMQFGVGRSDNYGPWPAVIVAYI